MKCTIIVVLRSLDTANSTSLMTVLVGHLEVIRGRVKFDVFFLWWLFGDADRDKENEDNHDVDDAVVDADEKIMMTIMTTLTIMTTVIMMAIMINMIVMMVVMMMMSMNMMMNKNMKMNMNMNMMMTMMMMTNMNMMMMMMTTTTTTMIRLCSWYVLLQRPWHSQRMLSPGFRHLQVAYDRTPSERETLLQTYDLVSSRDSITGLKHIE